MPPHARGTLPGGGARHSHPLRLPGRHWLSPGVAVVLLSIWRSPVDRRELARMLTDIYRVHLGTRLSGAFYPLGAVIAGALVFAFMLYLPFVAGYGAVRVLFYRAVGRSLPYERAHDPDLFAPVLVSALAAPRPSDVVGNWPLGGYARQRAEAATAAGRDGAGWLPCPTSAAGALGFNGGRLRRGRRGGDPEQVRHGRSA